MKTRVAIGKVKNMSGHLVKQISADGEFALYAYADGGQKLIEIGRIENSPDGWIGKLHSLPATKVFCGDFQKMVDYLLRLAQ